MLQAKVMRKTSLERKTSETDIALSINLDGTGSHDIETGIGFLDHMLAQLARHSLVDITIKAKGDLHIDDHHTVEDVGLALGAAFKAALGDKKGVRRYGTAYVPMDEALSRVSLDLSGRPFLVYHVAMCSEKIGSFDSQLVREFCQAFAASSLTTLHVETLYGDNSHHIAESCFKALAQALRKAVSIDERASGTIPSTKGIL
jgi:imidazoleglycerol-phosphate dehydratase